MKNLTLLKTAFIPFLIVPFLFAGCSEESEDLNNAFRYENTVFSINDAGIIDDGLYDLTEEDNSTTHYSYIFLLSDGNINLESTYLADSSASYVVVLFTYAPVNNDSEGFSEGIFKHVGDIDLFSGISELQGNYIFGQSYICIDENDDGIIEYSEGQKYMTGGISRIFGTSEKFDMNFTFNFSIGKKAEGRFSGPIEIFED